MQPPRTYDTTIMDIFLKQGKNGEGLRRLNRCRLKWELIFILDMATAGGARLDKTYLRAPSEDQENSDLNFPREEPSREDWKYWERFWRQYTDVGCRLERSLGAWTAISHRRWRWYYNNESGNIKEVKAERVRFYTRVKGRHRTRSKQVYQLTKEVLKPWPIPTIVESHFPRFQDTESLIWKRTFLHALTSLAQYESYVHKRRISLI